MNAVTARRGPDGLAGFLGHRELLATLVRRELRSRFKGTFAGVLWTYLNPLVMMVVYTIVFSLLWRSTEPHYPLVALTGQTIWMFFSAAVTTGTGSLVFNASLLTKVAFPREIVPASAVLAQLTTPAVMIVVLIPSCLIFIPGSAGAMWWAVVPVVGVTCLSLGIAWSLSSLNVLFRDVEHLVNVLMLPLFFLTPVLYRMENLPGGSENEVLVFCLRWLNPVTPYVEGFRAAFMDGQLPGWTNIVYTLVVGPVAMVVGLRLFRRLDDRVAVEL